MTSSSKGQNRIRPAYTGDANVILAEGYNLQNLTHYLCDLDDLYSDPESRIIKSLGHTKTAVVSLNLGKGKESFVLKKCGYKGFLSRVLQAFRQSKASKAWAMSLKFLEKGIPVTKPVALIEKRRKGIRRESYFLSAFAEDAVNLKAYVNSFGPDFLGDGRLLRGIGDVIGRMHQSGCLHGDLKWSNLMVTDPVGDPSPLFVDLEHARYGHRVSDQERAKDLARFMVDVHETALSADLSETFLEAYFYAAGIADGQRGHFRQQMDLVVRKISKRHKKTRNNDAGEHGNNAA